MSILNGSRKKGEQSQVGSSIVQVGLAATMASMLSACGGSGSTSTDNTAGGGSTSTGNTAGGGSTSTSNTAGGGSTSTDNTAGGGVNTVTFKSEFDAVYSKMLNLGGSITGKDLVNVIKQGLEAFDVSTANAVTAANDFKKEVDLDDGDAIRVERSSDGKTIYLGIVEENGTQYFKSVDPYKLEGNIAGLSFKDYKLTATDDVTKMNFEKSAAEKKSTTTHLTVEESLVDGSIKLIFEEKINGDLKIMKNTWDDTKVQNSLLPWSTEEDAGSSVSLKNFDVVYAQVGEDATKGNFNKLVLSEDYKFSDYVNVFSDPDPKANIKFPSLPGGNKDEDWVHKPNVDGAGKAYYDFQWYVKDSSSTSEYAYQKITTEGDNYYLFFDDAEFGNNQQVEAGDCVYLEVSFFDSAGKERYYAESDEIKLYDAVRLKYDSKPTNTSDDFSNNTKLNYGTDFLYVSFDNQGEINGIFDKTKAVDPEPSSFMSTVIHGKAASIYDTQGGFKYQWYKDTNADGKVGNDAPFSGQTNYYIHTDDLTNGDLVYIKVTSDNNVDYYSDIFEFQ